jgi:PAS domain S-box-containing protein
MDTSEVQEAARLLVVDEDPNAANRIKRLVDSRMRVEVESALNSASARRMLSSHSFDVVIVDHRHPDSSGLELLAEFIEQDIQTPVIFVTAHGSESLAAEAFNAGAAGYVIKDHTMPDVLPGVIEGALARSSLNRAAAVLNEENAFTDRALNLLGHMFFALDPEGRFIRWNKAVNEVTGWSNEELFRASADDFFPDDEGRRLLDTVLALKNGDRAALDLRIPTRNGGPVLREFTAVALYDSRGNLLGISAIGAGPAEVARKAAARREKNLVEIAKLACEIVVRLDMEGRFTFLNEEACTVLGGRRAQLIGQRITAFVHPDDIDKTLSLFARAVRTRQSTTGFISRIMAPRGWRYIEWNAMPLLDRYSECTGFQFVGRDITERKLTEQFLTRVNVELDAYAHTVSHDLKGPLSAIMLAAETLRVLLKNGAVEDPTKTMDEIARIISEHSEQAGTIIDDLLALAEAGQVPMEVEEVDVAAVVETVIEERAADIAQKGARVERDRDLGMVVANRTQVHQLFGNLIANAVRHNDSPEPVVEVRCRGKDEDGHRYVVRDNGSGIAAEEVDLIFKPFFKGKNGGTGIGLATVEKIVLVYGGHIEVHNEGGACFEFTLKDAPGVVEPSTQGGPRAP